MTPPLFSRFFLVSIICLSALGTGTDSCPADARGVSSFSLELRKTSMAQALEKISELSGYDIHISGAFPELPVNVSMKNATIEDVFTRILSNVNHALKWDLDQGRVTVFFFGTPDRKQSLKKSFTSGPPAVARPPQPSAVFSNRLPVPGLSGPPPSPAHRSPSTPSGVAETSLPDVRMSGTDTRFVQGTPTGDVSP